MSLKTMAAQEGPSHGSGPDPLTVRGKSGARRIHLASAAGRAFRPCPLAWSLALALAGIFAAGESSAQWAPPTPSSANPKRAPAGGQLEQEIVRELPGLERPSTGKRQVKSLDDEGFLAVPSGTPQEDIEDWVVLQVLKLFEKKSYSDQQAGEVAKLQRTVEAGRRWANRWTGGWRKTLLGSRNELVDRQLGHSDYLMDLEVMKAKLAQAEERQTGIAEQLRYLEKGIELLADSIETLRREREALVLGRRRYVGVCAKVSTAREGGYDSAHYERQRACRSP